MDEKTNTGRSLPARRETTEVVAMGDTRPAKEFISDLTCRKLIKQAIDMLKQAYAPYSHFKVGAALLGLNNKIYTGCNIENAAYSPSNCAERTAFFKAVSEGIHDFVAIAIVGGTEGKIKDYCAPCGVCRQVMAEFCNPESFYVILATSEEDYWVYRLAELFPMSFSPKSLKN